MLSTAKIKKPPDEGRFFLGEPAGTRTQGPYIKSVLLYQLSYEFIPLRKRECKNNGFLLVHKMNLKK